MMQQYRWCTLVPFVLLLLSGCSTQQTETAADTSPTPATESADAPAEQPSADQASTSSLNPYSSWPQIENLAPPQPLEPTNRRFTLISPGDGVIRNTVRKRNRKVDRSGEISLNFKDADIREISRTILGDILGRNYTIDDRVTGSFSLHTSRPVSSDALIPILESMLTANDALLHDTGDIIEIVPQSKLLLGRKAPGLRLNSARGYQTLVVPLRYIAAPEMARILGATDEAQKGIEIDRKRNLMLLTGTQQQLAVHLDTIDIFDVNQLKGMAIGFMELEAVSTDVMLAELEAIFSDQANGPLAGMVRFVPIERLNSLLIITPQRQYLDAARNWIERLDRHGGEHNQQLHVYKVRHSTAAHLADLLGQLFSTPSPILSGSGPLSPSPLTPASSTTAAAGGGQQLSLTSTPRPPGTPGISITADSQNNSLLIMASDEEFQRIKVALNKLDVLPAQVLVEASIVEVTLSDDLQFGLEWFFRNGINSKRGRGQLDLGAAGLTALSPGFSYSLVDSAGAVRAVFNTLASDNKVNVVSSPSLMVLDNQSASIRVGDQVPIRTSETTNTGSSGADPLVTSTIQFRDTGVLLEVTPRIKDGGMVVLDINQDVSDVAQTTSSGIDSPTINQRQINTTVAVHSGDTIVLGGLIRENQDRGNSGVPGLRNIPVLGWAFGETRKQRRRTELVVLITPTAITNREEARQVTREFRNHLKGLELPRSFRQQSQL